MDIEKACVNCRHFHLMPERGPVCMRFAKQFAGAFDPVYGSTKHISAPDCSVARGEKGQCGPKGRFWTDKYASQAPVVVKHEELATTEYVTEPLPWWRSFLPW